MGTVRRSQRHLQSCSGGGEWNPKKCRTHTVIPPFADGSLVGPGLIVPKSRRFRYLVLEKLQIDYLD